MKFSNSEFVIDKAYAETLVQKREAFRSKSKTKKTLSIVMVTTFGTRENSYKTSLVQNDVKLESLFKIV